MKKWIIGVVLLCCLACNKQTPMLNKLPDDAVILAFGDSLTYGTGASAEHDYPNILAGLSGREVINAGVPGELSGEGRQRLPQLLDQYQPDLLILIHGGNDILKKMPAEQTLDNLKAMIGFAKQRKIAVIMMGVPQFGLVFLHSAAIYEQVAKAESVPVDLDTLPTILATNALKTDPVHPNDQGYQQLAERIVALLQEQGAL